MPPTPLPLAPGAKFAANGRVLLSERDRRFSWSDGTAREIEVELDEDPTVRVRMVDWKQEKTHGDPVRVTGTIEAVRPWSSQGRSFRTVTLAKGHRMVTVKPPSVEEPAQGVPGSEEPGSDARPADDDDPVINGIWLF